jgi:hypothetical protein
VKEYPLFSLLLITWVSLCLSILYKVKVHAGELMPTCQQTAQAVLSMVADIQEMGDRPESAAASQQLSWRSPARGCLKINFNRAFMQQTNTGAWGFIVRDHEG